MDTSILFCVFNNKSKHTGPIFISDSENVSTYFPSRSPSSSVIIASEPPSGLPAGTIYDCDGIEYRIDCAGHYEVSGNHLYKSRYSDISLFVSTWDQKKYGNKKFPIKAICGIGDWGDNYKNIQALVDVKCEECRRDPKFSEWVGVATIEPKSFLKAYLELNHRYE